MAEMDFVWPQFGRGDFCMAEMNFHFSFFYILFFLQGSKLALETYMFATKPSLFILLYQYDNGKKILF